MQYPRDRIDGGSEYYALTYLADTQGKVWLDAHTIWTSFADEERRIELRKPSVVIARRIADLWEKLGMPYCVVNTTDDFAKWFITGGHALVQTRIAEMLLPDAMKEAPSVQLGRSGFRGTELLAKAVFRRAPTPKKRMEVMKRDRYRCKICGRRPDDYVDIELNVHHIKPRGKGGLTHEDNLITLCDTCHKGLEPHYEWALFELLQSDGRESHATKRRREYLEAVQNYRIATRRMLEMAE